MNNPRSISIFGVTGSIGISTQEVILLNKNNFIKRGQLHSYFSAFAKLPALEPHSNELASRRARWFVCPPLSLPGGAPKIGRINNGA